MTWLRLIVAVGAACVVAYLVHWDATHPEISFLPALTIAQVPSLAALLVIAFRSYSIAGGAIPFAVVVRGNALAISGSLIVPARLSELGKPFYFFALAGYPRRKGLALVIEERVWDVVIVALLCIASLMLLGEQSGNSGLVAAAWTMNALAVGGLIVLVAIPRISHRLPLPERLKDGLGILRRLNLQEITVHLLQSVAIWTASFFILIVFYKLCGMPELTLVRLFFLFVASTLGLVVSVTPGGLGTYEGSIVAVLASYGIDWGDGLAFALGFRFCWMLLPLTAGLAAVWVDGRYLAEKRASEGAGDT